MAKIAEKVYLLLRSERLSGDQTLQAKVMNSEKIEICWSYQAVKINGDKKVESVIIKNLNIGKQRNLDVDAIFIEIGLLPNSGFVCENLEINNYNEVVVDENNQTSVEGAKAAPRANEYLS